MITSASTSYSLPCTTKDIQTFVIRKPKHLRVVNQFNEDEPLPPHLVFQFFRKVKEAKQLKAFNLKWNYSTGQHIKPEIIKSVFKRHCQNIQKYNVAVTDKSLPYHYKNLCVPLKNVTTASCDNSKDIRKILALRAVENLRIDLKSDKNDYKTLYQVLYRLSSLKNLYVACLQSSLDDVLAVLNELTMTKPHVKFEVSVIGKQNYLESPQIETRVSKRITNLSFQNVHPSALLNNVFIGKPFLFNNLKSLVLEFNTMSIQEAYCLQQLQKMTSLERLVLAVHQYQDTQVAGSIITGLRLPASLESLHLNMPLHLSSLLTKTKRFLNKNNSSKKGQLWRTKNIFEEEPAFAFFFQTFAEATKLRNIVFDFHMLENFNNHYTNFIISILSRLLDLVSLEIQVVNDQNQHLQEATQGSFDLAPFFKVCSQMPQIEQIEILMPNLIFEDAEFTPSTTCLKNFTIGVDEKDEDKPLKFVNIGRPVEKLLKALMRYQPSLENLSLDFAEEITQRTLLKRFHMIENFKNLEALGARFFIEKCNEETTREVGRVVSSLSKLNMLLLKFLETEKTVYSIQNYIKYHKSLRNMMIQFNDSAWMDNECLIDPLNTQIKETKAEMEEEENGVENQNILDQSFDELLTE